jgi:hypothetical protein
MPPDDLTTPAPAAPESAPPPYVPPRLVVHGPIRDLTAATADGQASILPDS